MWRGSDKSRKRQKTQSRKRLGRNCLLTRCTCCPSACILKVPGCKQCLCLTSRGGHCVVRRVGNKYVAMGTLLKSLSDLSFLLCKKWTGFQKKLEAKLPSGSGVFSKAQGSIFTPSTSVLEVGVERMLGRSCVYWHVPATCPWSRNSPPVDHLQSGSLDDPRTALLGDLATFTLHGEKSSWCLRLHYGGLCLHVLPECDTIVMWEAFFQITLSAILGLTFCTNAMC